MNDEIHICQSFSKHTYHYIFLTPYGVSRRFRRTNLRPICRLHNICGYIFVAIFLKDLIMSFQWWELKLNTSLSFCVVAPKNYIFSYDFF